LNSQESGDSILLDITRAVSSCNAQQGWDLQHNRRDSLWPCTDIIIALFTSIYFTVCSVRAHLFMLDSLNCFVWRSVTTFGNFLIRNSYVYDIFIRRGHGCLSLVSVVCCQVGVFVGLITHPEDS